MRRYNYYERKKLKTLVVIETVLIVLMLIIGFFAFKLAYEKTELFREVSPNGDFTIVVQRRGMIDWPFGDDHLRVYLGNNEGSSYFHMAFLADVANNGAPAGYKVEWLDDAAKITLSGNEQLDAVYILPFWELE